MRRTIFSILLGLTISCLPNFVSYAAPPSSNGLIAFSSNRNGNEEIYLMNPDGSDQVNLTNNGEEDLGPTWSPDGKKIAFTRGITNREVIIMNSDGTAQTNLTNNPALDAWPSWSPDSTEIVFTSDRDGNREIYIMNSDGTNVRRITNTPENENAPQWSPDGEDLLFVSYYDGGPEIYLIEPDGTNLRRVTNNAITENFPRWSPDSAQITFGADEGGFSNIYVVNSDGSNQNALTDNASSGESDLNPSWSHDGLQIIFTSNRSSDFEIYRMLANGTNSVRITQSNGDDGGPAWSYASNDSRDIYMYEAIEYPCTPSTPNCLATHWYFQNSVTWFNEYEITGLSCTTTSNNATCESKGWQIVSGKSPPLYRLYLYVYYIGEEKYPVTVEEQTITARITYAPRTNSSDSRTISIAHNYLSESPVISVDLNERSTGGVIRGNFYAILEEDGGNTFNCYGFSPTTCDTFFYSYNSSTGKYEGYAAFSNYIQGASANAKIALNWRSSNGATTQRGTTISRIGNSTFQVGLLPTISNLRSEIGGCSFNIDNYDPNFTYFFKHRESDVSINSSGYVRITGQRDGETIFDYPSTRRTGYTERGNVSAEFSCVSLTKEDRILIEKANAEAAARAAEEEAARQAEIRRQNAISEIIRLQAGTAINLATLREAGIHFAINETIEKLKLYILSLDASTRGNIQLINEEADRLKQEYYFELLESEVSFTNLQSLGFKNISDRVMQEVKESLANTQFVKTRNRVGIQKEIDKVVTLFKGRDLGTLSEGELQILGVNIDLQSKKSEVLLRFRNESPSVFLNSQSITLRIREIENLIQQRLNRTADAKKRTQEIRERLEKRKANTSKP